MNGSIDERIVNLLKNQIKNNYFKSKEDLINDPMFKNFIENIKPNDTQGVRDVKMEILSYYDELFKTKEELNLENIFDLENSNGNNFAQYVNENKESLILENDLGNKDAKDLILDKQNELITKGDNVITNDLNVIMDEIKKDKIEVEMINDVKPELLNKEQQTQLEAIKKSDVLENEQINFDPTNNLFVNAKTGDSFTVNENNQGNFEIQSAVMTDDVKTGVSDKPVIDEVKEEEIEIKQEPLLNENINDQVNEINKYDQFSVTDLKWTLENAKDKFPAEEISKMEAAYNAKVSTLNEKEIVIEQPKVLTLKKEFTGFSSLLFLCLTTGIGAISIFMYILLIIGV